MYSALLLFQTSFEYVQKNKCKGCRELLETVHEYHQGGTARIIVFNAESFGENSIKFVDEAYWDGHTCPFKKWIELLKSSNLKR